MRTDERSRGRTAHVAPRARRPGNGATGEETLDRALLDRVRDAEAHQPVRVSIVIPALNEATNLPHVLPRLEGLAHEVVLTDGNSDDGTCEVARSLRPDIVTLVQDGRGKGNALSAGFAAASGDIIVMLDADGSTDPAEIPSFVGALLAGADFAKGSRFLHGAGTPPICRSTADGGTRRSCCSCACSSEGATPISVTGTTRSGQT